MRADYTFSFSMHYYYNSKYYIVLIMLRQVLRLVIILCVRVLGTQLLLVALTILLCLKRPIIKCIICRFYAFKYAQLAELPSNTFELGINDYTRNIRLQEIMKSLHLEQKLTRQNGLYITLQIHI